MTALGSASCGDTPAQANGIPAFDRSGKPNTGHALETAVLIELERRSCQLAYVRTKTGCEVDFLATDPEGGKTYIQVCSDLSTPEVRQREFRPLPELVSSRKGNRVLLLTLTTTDVSICQKDVPPGVTVKPAWAWMLEGEKYFERSRSQQSGGSEIPLHHSPTAVIMIVRRRGLMSHSR